jgi:hypothetical protein
VVLHAHPAPIIDLWADYENRSATDGGSWRRLFFCPWFSDQLVDQVDVVDVFLINA